MKLTKGLLILSLIAIPGKLIFAQEANVIRTLSSTGGLHLAVDSSGNIFFSTLDCTIRKLPADGGAEVIIAPISGRCDSGTFTNHDQSMVALDGSGNVYTNDNDPGPFGGYMIQKFSADGTISVVIGNGAYPQLEGAACSSVNITDLPSALATDSSGGLYYTQTGRIYKCLDNVIHLIANANVSRGIIWDLAIDSRGAIFFSDDTRIMVLNDRTITTLVDIGGLTPQGIAIDPSGDILVACGNNVIQRCNNARGCVAVAGTTGPSSSESGTLATSFRFTNPHDVAVDPQGRIVIIDDNGIYRMEPAQADLSLRKSAGTAYAGRRLSYNLTVTNNGPHMASNVQVTDTLPSGVEFVSASPSQGTCAHENNVVTCNVGALENSRYASIRINVQILPWSLVNTATVTSGSVDSASENNTATVTSNVNPAPSRRR